LKKAEDKALEKIVGAEDKLSEGKKMNTEK